MARTRNRRKKLPQKPVAWRPIFKGIGIFCAFALVFGLCFYGWQTFKHAKVLLVKQIIVRGQQKITRNEVLQTMGLKAGDPLLQLHLATMADKLHHHAWIKKAHIQRVMPDTVLVTVEEHQPVMQVELEQMYLADADGTLFVKTPVHQTIEKPVLKGLRSKDAQRMSESLELLNVATKSFGPLKELYFDEALGFSVVIAYDEKQNVRIHLGFQPTQRVPAANTTLQRLRELGRVPDVIWADGIKNPDRIHVKLAS